jgi:ATP adenylyltransferase
MSLEIYWKKALEQTRLSIDDESLYPLKTDIITSDLYHKNDFIIRKLDTSKFNKKKKKKFMVLSRIHFIHGKKY